MAHHLHSFSVMNYLDLIIIYLACGAPFGVYHFFNNRHSEKTTWVKSILAVIIWIPYAFKLLHHKVTNLLNNENSTQKKELIKNLQKELENSMSDKFSEISIFELREVIERYTELTIANSEMNGTPATHEKELYRLQSHKNADISAICLNRKNQNKLKRHQINARIDFIETLKKVFYLKEQPQLVSIAKRLVKVIGDDIAHNQLQEMTENSTQTFQKPTVKHLETELWKPQEQKLSKEKQISIPL